MYRILKGWQKAWTCQTVFLLPPRSQLHLLKQNKLERLTKTSTKIPSWARQDNITFLVCIYLLLFVFRFCWYLNISTTRRKADYKIGKDWKQGWWWWNKQRQQRFKISTSVSQTFNVKWLINKTTFENTHLFTDSNKIY